MVRVGVELRQPMRVRVRVRFACCSFGFNFTEYIHAASLSIEQITLNWHRYKFGAGHHQAEAHRRAKSGLMPRLDSV